MDRLLVAQKNEITEHIVYNKLSSIIRDKKNAHILNSISSEELEHYNFWKIHTKKDVKPNRFKIWKYYWISRIFGINFGIKLMENGEADAQINYERISQNIPEAKKILDDENEHENQLISIINEERLIYVSSVVLGLNDALVELTGALAGFTLALQNTRLIAFMGLITGIAASFSMGASEYLATKSEKGLKNPFKASIYTTVAYVLTVISLILPFLILNNIYISLGVTIIAALMIIFVFTFYVSVATGKNLKRNFLEMAFISLGVALLSFGIGYLVRLFFNVGI